MPDLSSIAGYSRALPHRPAAGHTVSFESIVKERKEDSNWGILNTSSLARRDASTTSAQSREVNASRIKTLADVLYRFPSFPIDGTPQADSQREDFACENCDAVFSAQDDLICHQSSDYCLGNTARAFILYRDSSQIGAYRIEERRTILDQSLSLYKCPKCAIGFSSRTLLQEHESKHSTSTVMCLHCHFEYESPQELEMHYQWHDDMEFRHHKDTILERQPGTRLRGLLHGNESISSNLGTARTSYFLDGRSLSSEDGPQSPLTPSAGQISFHYPLVQLTCGRHFANN